MKKIHELLGDRKAYSVKPSMTVHQTLEYMCAHKIGAVAVCENNKVVGVFSERDLIRRVVDENDQLQGFVSMRELIEEDLNESRELVHKLNDEYYEEHFQPSRH